MSYNSFFCSKFAHKKRHPMIIGVYVFEIYLGYRYSFGYFGLCRIYYVLFYHYFSG